MGIFIIWTISRYNVPGRYFHMGLYLDEGIIITTAAVAAMQLVQKDKLQI